MLYQESFKADNHFNKSIRIKINKQKSVSFLLPCSKQIGKNQEKKRPFIVDSINIEITHINKVKDAYNKKTVKE